MSTGKTRMLRTRRDLFIKQRSGTVVPILTYLFVNNLSRKHMILIFEPNYAYKVFDDGTSVDRPYSFLLANEDFKLGEIANTFHYITGIHQTAFK